MAPLAPLGRDAAIDLVMAADLPFTFGSPHPHTAIVEQDGVFRIRQLVVPDGARATTPEQYYALGEPTGTIHVEAKTRNDLVEIMKTMPWPADW